MAGSARDDSGGFAVLPGLLAWAVLALMAASAVYTVWIAVVNFHRIGV